MHARDRGTPGAHGCHRAQLGICLALLTAFATPGAAACRDDTLIIKDDDSQARFRVDVADDDAERARGLMFVEDLAQAQGMLFVYDRPQPVAFWMENTLIPLDMIFIGADGTVTRIHENAVPLDRTSIFGGEAVQFVLEINGGLARRLGLEEGAVIQHPAVPQDIAAFPCD
ncbi:MAG: DUF192 domain-containing protein [Pseudomonadota bacterium]